MPTASDAWLARVARQLGDLKDEVVFVGGAIVSLLVDDPASTPIRPTDDLDMIVDVSSRVHYDALAKRLRSRGFEVDASEGAPLCRWRLDDIVVDVMPSAPDVLGFTNRWYAAAIASAIEREIESGLTIKIAAAPYFVAMKLEAFAGRGRGDYVASHDLEDIVAITDARTALLEEIEQSPQDLRDYLADRIGHLLERPAFVDALPGHLAGDSSGQDRLPIVLGRLRVIARKDPAG